MNKKTYPNYHLMQKQRIELLKRSGGKCEACGKERAELIHHLDSGKENHDLGNLIIVCHKCHKFLHAKFNKDGFRLPLGMKRTSKYIDKFGMSLREMGLRLGVSHEYVRRLINDPRYGEAWIKEQLRKAKK